MTGNGVPLLPLSYIYLSRCGRSVVFAIQGRSNANCFGQATGKSKLLFHKGSMYIGELHTMISLAINITFI